jgi:hypothetical protein
MLDDEGIIRGRANIAASVEGVLGAAVTVTTATCTRSNRRRRTQRYAVWAMEDLLQFPEGAPIRSLHGFGHYQEMYEKIDGDWAIKTLTLSRPRVDTKLVEWSGRPTGRLDAGLRIFVRPVRWCRAPWLHTRASSSPGSQTIDDVERFGSDERGLER